MLQKRKPEMIEILFYHLYDSFLTVVLNHIFFHWLSLRKWNQRLDTHLPKRHKLGDQQASTNQSFVTSSAKMYVILFPKTCGFFFFFLFSTFGFFSVIVKIFRSWIWSNAVIRQYAPFFWDWKNLKLGTLIFFCWISLYHHVFNLNFGSISEKRLRIVHLTICFIGITRWN
jgi:hypothetical protein